MSLCEDREAIRYVAHAIAEVVAGKVVAEDPKLRSLDGLGGIMARTKMAEGMVGDLIDEAMAAIAAVETLRGELVDGRAL